MLPILAKLAPSMTRSFVICDRRSGLTWVSRVLPGRRESPVIAQLVLLQRPQLVLYLINVWIGSRWRKDELAVFRIYRHPITYLELACLMETILKVGIDKTR